MCNFISVYAFTARRLQGNAALKAKSKNKKRSVVDHFHKHYRQSLQCSMAFWVGNWHVFLIIWMSKVDVSLPHKIQVTNQWSAQLFLLAATCLLLDRECWQRDKVKKLLLLLVGKWAFSVLLKCFSMLCWNTFFYGVTICMNTLWIYAVAHMS